MITNFTNAFITARFQAANKLDENNYGQGSFIPNIEITAMELSLIHI